ncbi:hypothetical protein N8198_05525 [Gammaproteobacteria bacterium]|nr:hypothetical protein [Gammaproteobacteria bacterium]
MNSDHRVTQQATRLAGLINAVAGVCVGLAYVLHPHYATPGVVSSSFWFWVHVLFAISLLGGIFGALGIFAHHSGKTSWSGLVGMALIVTSLTLIFGLNYWEALIIPVVAAQAPEFVEMHGAGEAMGMVAIVFPLSGALFVLGYGLLCTDIIRAKSLPAGAAWLTICGVIIFGAGLSGFFPMLVVKVGAVLFALGLVWLGLSLWRYQD